jgi:hypothetical protein
VYQKKPKITYYSIFYKTFLICSPFPFYPHPNFMLKCHKNCKLTMCIPKKSLKDVLLNFYIFFLFINPLFHPLPPKRISLKNNQNRSLMDTYLCVKFEVDNSIRLKVIEGTNRPTNRPTDFFLLNFIHFFWSYYNSPLCDVEAKMYATKTIYFLKM